MACTAFELKDGAGVFMPGVRHVLAVPGERQHVGLGHRSTRLPLDAVEALSPRPEGEAPERTTKRAGSISGLPRKVPDDDAGFVAVSVSGILRAQRLVGPAELKRWICLKCKRPME